MFLCVLIFMLLEAFYIKGGSNGWMKKFVVFCRAMANQRGGSVLHAAQFACVSTTIFRNVTLCFRIKGHCASDEPYCSHLQRSSGPSRDNSKSGTTLVPTRRHIPQESSTAPQWRPQLVKQAVAVCFDTVYSVHRDLHRSFMTPTMLIWRLTIFPCIAATCFGVI